MISLKAPIVITSAFVAGVLLAVGHHVFYSGLDGQPVPTTPSSVGKLLSLGPQKFNISVGNTFAILSKMFICYAVGAAYLQVLVRLLKQKSTELRHIDAAFSLADDPISMLNLPVWKRFAGAACLACLVWLFPIAAVITPSTLSVELSANKTTASMNVSNVDFTSLNFASVPIEAGTRITQYIYAGPQYAVTRVVAATAAEGAMLPIAAPGPAPNVTYAQSFLGPVLRCEHVSGTLLSNITKNIKKVSNIHIATENGYNFPNSYGYLAWTPDATGLEPFIINNNRSAYSLRAGTLGPMSNGPETNGQASIFVATLSGMSYTATLPFNETVTNATVLQCKLYNETYDLSLEWSNGAQSIDVTHETSYGPVIPQSLLSGDIDGLKVSPTSTGPYAYNVSLVRTFAYQAVMDAFGQLLVGSVGVNAATQAALQTANTTVMNTILGDGKELAFIRKWGMSEIGSSYTSFQAMAAASNGTLWSGVSVPPNSTAGTLELQTAIEALFENITISLMSSTLLQADPRSPFAPGPVPVTTVTYENFYVYSAATLWAAYGTMILLAAIAITVGLTAGIVDRGFYTNNFSTTMRLVHGAELSASITEADAVGHDPLPEHLATARITFASSNDFSARDGGSARNKSGAGVRARLL